MIEIDLKVLDGIDLTGGKVNTEDGDIRRHIEHSIRLGFTQARPQALQPERVLLVGGGPSLEHTKDELVELYFAGGAKVVALNGAYQWCLRNHIKPHAVVIVDARPNNAHFLTTAVPGCRYLIASQCHPSTWEAVNDGREGVVIWHAVAPEGEEKDILDTYYFGNWAPIAGGTTVAMRALALLRILGYMRFDIFGVDSCWLGDQHHAFAQSQNDSDPRVPFKAWPSGHPERAREFFVAPWHLKQLEDLLQLIRIAGDEFLLNIHGDGLLAFALREAADIEYDSVTEG